MKKLDWYILRKFFSTFFFCMLSFTVIAVAVDSSEKTDDFVKTGLSTYEIFRQYYVGFVPFIWGLLFPLFVFIAVIFFTSKMALRSEVIAILASGTTFQRWLRPYVLGGILLGLVLWFANRFAIPKANEIRSVFETKYLNGGMPQGSPGSQNSFYKKLDSVTYVGIKYFDPATKSASVFFLNRVRQNKVVYNLRADRLEWDSTKKIWKLTNVTERTIDSTREYIQQHPQKNLALNLQPSELRKDEFLKDKLTSQELSHLPALLRTPSAAQTTVPDGCGHALEYPGVHCTGRGYVRLRDAHSQWPQCHAVYNQGHYQHRQ